MADKLFRDYFNEKVTDTVLPVNAKVLIQDGTGEPTQINAASIGAGQLVKVTENGKTGYRLKDADPANYGDIGDDAVDLSISQSPSTTNGAIGDHSHASGLNTTAIGQESHAEGQSTKALGEASHAEGRGTDASGQASHSEGNNTIASGASSHAEGIATTASGAASHAEGIFTIASGAASHAEGQRTFARSFAEHSGGLNGTDYTPQSTTGFDLTDRLVNYGNGLDQNNRSDAYTLFKNGMQKFFTAALSTITNAVKGSVMLDENAMMHINDGTAFKAVAFSDEVKSLKNDIVKGASYFNDFDGATGSGVNDGTFFAVSLGGGLIGLASDPLFDEDDVLRLRCSSAINSRALFYNGNLTIALFKNIEYRAKLRVVNLATTADKYLFTFGRVDSATIAAASIAYGFFYDKAGDYLGTASDNWLAVNKNGANSTIVDTGVAVIDSAHVRLMIKFTPTSIAYFINGVLVATITTNINSGTASQDILGIQKTAAGTINQEVLVDYYSRTQTKITPRIYDN